MTDKRYETKQKNHKCTKRERVKYKKYTKIKKILKKIYQEDLCYTKFFLVYLKKKLAEGTASQWSLSVSL